MSAKGTPNPLPWPFNNNNNNNNKFYFSLSVKDATNNCKILSDTMNTNETVKLVKFSSKRDNILGDIKANLCYEGDEGVDVASLAKFSATRWTVRAIFFQRVIENYGFL